MMRVFPVFCLGMALSAPLSAEVKWGMVDNRGNFQIPERFDEMGFFCGDLANGLLLEKSLAGQKGAKIVKWMKTEGQEVKKGEVLALLELKEPSVPLVAPVSGMLTKIGVPAGGAAIPGSSLGSIRVLGRVDLFSKKQYEVEWTEPGSATVVRWLKMEGDAVAKGETMAEVRPMQVTRQLTAPWSGTLVKIEVSEGGEAATGQVLARMGMGRVAVRSGRDWFFVDERGNPVSAARFDHLGIVRGGLAPVRVGDRWGFVNGEGNLIGQADYEETREVRGGLAAVKKGGQWGFVAYQEGTLKNATPPVFLQAKDFAEGLAAVVESEDAPLDEPEETNFFVEKEEKKQPAGPPVWGYIMPSGKLWIRSQYAEAGNFLDGRAVVKPEGEGATVGMIDSRGGLKSQGVYKGLVLLGEKRAAWKGEMGWGLMDLQEKVFELAPGQAVQDVLASLGPFGSGLAPAKDGGGKWGYLNKEGRWIISPRFERARVFRGGLAAVKEPGGKWGFLRPDGTWAIAANFTRARSFSDGLAAVSSAGEPESGVDPETEGSWE